MQAIKEQKNKTFPVSKSSQPKNPIPQRSTNPSPYSSSSSLLSSQQVWFHPSRLFHATCPSQPGSAFFFDLWFIFWFFVFLLLCLFRLDSCLKNPFLAVHLNPHHSQSQAARLLNPRFLCFSVIPPQLLWALLNQVALPLAKESRPSPSVPSFLCTHFVFSEQLCCSTFKQLPTFSTHITTIPISLYWIFQTTTKSPYYLKSPSKYVLLHWIEKVTHLSSPSTPWRSINLPGVLSLHVVLGPNRFSFKFKDEEEVEVQSPDLKLNKMIWTLILILKLMILRNRRYQNTKYVTHSPPTVSLQQHLSYRAVLGWSPGQDHPHAIPTNHDSGCCFPHVSIFLTLRFSHYHQKMINLMQMYIVGLVGTQRHIHQIIRSYFVTHVTSLSTSPAKVCLNPFLEPNRVHQQKIIHQPPLPS